MNLCFLGFIYTVTSKYLTQVTKRRELLKPVPKYRFYFFHSQINSVVSVACHRHQVSPRLARAGRGGSGKASCHWPTTPGGHRARIRAMASFEAAFDARGYCVTHSEVQLRKQKKNMLGMSKGTVLSQYMYSAVSTVI